MKYLKSAVALFFMGSVGKKFLFRPPALSRGNFGPAFATRNINNISFESPEQGPIGIKLKGV